MKKKRTLITSARFDEIIASKLLCRRPGERFVLLLRRHHVASEKRMKIKDFERY